MRRKRRMLAKCFHSFTETKNKANEASDINCTCATHKITEQQHQHWISLAPARRGEASAPAEASAIASVSYRWAVSDVAPENAHTHHTDISGKSNESCDLLFIFAFAVQHVRPAIPIPPTNWVCGAGCEREFVLQTWEHAPQLQFMAVGSRHSAYKWPKPTKRSKWPKGLPNPSYIFLIFVFFFFFC